MRFRRQRKQALRLGSGRHSRRWDDDAAQVRLEELLTHEVCVQHSVVWCTPQCGEPLSHGGRHARVDQMWERIEAVWSHVEGGAA